MKNEHDITNLEFLISDPKTTITVKQNCINQLMHKYRERAAIKA